MRLRPRLALAAALLAALPAVGRDSPPAVVDSQVRIERSGDFFTIDLLMHAPVEPALAWAVLTDFEHMADFVPNLSSSQVVERKESSLTVSQKGTARYGLFSADFESLREIRLIPKREIRAHGIGGNMKRTETVMQLEAEDGGTRLRYHAEAQPAFWVPPLIGPAFMQHEAAEQFSALIREMRRRQALTGAPN